MAWRAWMWVKVVKRGEEWVCLRTKVCSSIFASLHQRIVLSVILSFMQRPMQQSCSLSDGRLTGRRVNTWNGRLHEFLPFLAYKVLKIQWDGLPRRLHLYWIHMLLQQTAGDTGWNVNISLMTLGKINNVFTVFVKRISWFLSIWILQSVNH